VFLQSPLPATICKTLITRLERRRRVITLQAFYNAASDVLRIALAVKSNNSKINSIGVQAKITENTINTTNLFVFFDLVAGSG